MKKQLHIIRLLQQPHKTIILLFAAIILATTISVLALEIPWPKSTIYTKELRDIINTENIDDPLRGWSYYIINNENIVDPGEESQEIKGVINIGEIQEHSQAQLSIMALIKNIINYILGATWLIALIYLLVHGFIILTAAWDDTKYKKWLKWIKYAAIALVGIGLSFFMISLIFYIIRIITGR